MKMKNAITQTIMRVLLCPEIRKATKYLGERDVVKCTRQRKFDGRTRGETFLLTVGRPNYTEKKFIKAYLMAGEPFPVKRVQVQWYPIKEKK